MKEGIHPVYEEATVHCACGSVIKTRSTKKDISVEICSSCHPFYTGTQKFVDTAGKIEKFERKYRRKKQLPGGPAVKVTLLNSTPDPEVTIAMAARLCYSDATVEELKDKVKKISIEKFLGKIIKMGHLSVLE